MKTYVYYALDTQGVRIPDKYVEVGGISNDEEANQMKGRYLHYLKNHNGSKDVDITDVEWEAKCVNTETVREYNN